MAGMIGQRGRQEKAGRSAESCAATARGQDARCVSVLGVRGRKPRYQLTQALCCAQLCYTRRGDAFGEKDCILAYGDLVNEFRGLGLAAMMVAATGGGALAQSGNFELELNTAADVEGSCRLTFVATNGTGVALIQTAYQVAAFDSNGQVSAIVVLEFGELPLSKTRVVQFDLPDLTCTSLSRLVVNDLDTCKTAEAESDVCMKALSASSRIPNIPFGL